MKTMKILDPIYKYIYFSEHEKSLIDTLTFQRLRNIKQLGFTDRTFIGACHNRFSHSLGAAHLAGLAFNSIFEKNHPLSEKKQQDFYQFVRVLALIHDIGHGPLSHSSEPCMPLKNQLDLPSHLKKDSSQKATHEDYSTLLILQNDVQDALKEMGINPDWIISILQHTSDEDSFFIDQGISYKPLLEQIVHSEIDVDRMDYLKRDSYFCGTYYGDLDFDWLLTNFSYHIESNKAFLALKSPALYTIEDFLLGHHHMHLTVYFHQKNMIYDEMLTRYIQHPKCRFKFPTHAKDYISCTDSWMDQCLKEDAPHIEWAQRIVSHNPYKHIFQIQYTSNLQKTSEEKIEKVHSKLKNSSIPFIEKTLTSHLAGTFNQNFEHSIYVTNPHSKETKKLQDSVRVFNPSDRTVHLHHIYADKKDHLKARQLIDDLYRKGL